MIEALKAQLLEKEEHNTQQVEQSLKDLEAAKTAAAAEGSAKTTKLLEELKQSHEKELNQIQEQLTQTSSEYDQRLKQASKDIDTARTAATEQGSAEHARSMEEQRQAHTEALQQLERELEQRHQDEKAALSEETSGETQRVLNDLKGSHTTELEALKAELAEKDAQYQNNLEAAQGKELESASQVQQITLQLTELRSELESAKQSLQDATKIESAIKDKDEQLVLKTKELLDGQSLIEQLKSTHAGHLEQLKASHNETLRDSEAAASKRLETLTASHKAELQRNAETAAASVGDITRKDAEVTQLGKAIENLQQELETLREEKDHEIESVKVSLAENYEHDLQAALKEAETNFETSSSGLTSEHERAISGKQSLIESLSTERDSALKIKADLKQELQDAAAQIHGLKGILQDFDQEGQDKDQQHQAALTKISSELDRTSKALEAMSQENKSALDKHAEELDQLRANHAKELDSLKTDSTAADALKSEHEQQLKSLKESHTEIASTLEEQIKQLETENKKRSVEQQETAKNHETELDDLRYQLVKVKSDFASAQAELEGSSGQRGLIESLKEEISNLKKVHEAKLADLDEQRKSEADKHLKERQSGAEVRDRLVSQLAELEGFRAELPSAHADVKKHKADAEAALLEAQRTKSELERVAFTKAQLNQSLIDSNGELQTIRAEFEKFKKNARRRSRSASAYKRDLEALQISSEKEHEQVGVLKRQLEEALEAVERNAKKVREVESSLGATKLEMKELRAKNLNTGNKDLLSSRWAADEKAAADDEKVQPEGTELGSHIEGAVGSPISITSSTSLPPLAILNYHFA